MFDASRDFFIVPKKLITHYAQLEMSETELAVIMQLLLIQSESNEMPSFDRLAGQSSMNINQVAMLIEGLIQKDFIHISVIEKDDVYKELFSLTPLGEKLEKLEIKQVDHFNALFERFESVLARPLTPIEMQTLTHWLDTDHHSVDIIQAALDEAAAHDKVSFKYIDRILLNWQKRGVKTIADSKEVSQNFRQEKKMVKAVEQFPVFDWVHGDNPYDK